jgi:hypothetical protein
MVQPMKACVILLRAHCGFITFSSQGPIFWKCWRVWWMAYLDIF